MKSIANFSKLFAAALGAAAIAGFAAPAHAAGDPASVAAKYPTVHSPYTGAQYPAPQAYDRGVTPNAYPGTAPQPFGAYLQYDGTANLGQGSGMGDAIGR